MAFIKYIVDPTRNFENLVCHTFIFLILQLTKCWDSLQLKKPIQNFALRKAVRSSTRMLSAMEWLAAPGSVGADKEESV